MSGPLDLSSVDQINSLLGRFALPESETVAFVEALQQRQGKCLRYKRKHLPTETSSSDDAVIPWYDLARRWDNESFRATRSLQYAAAQFYVQDSGSLLALACAQANQDWLAGKLVCDLCAAPGGKATGLLEGIGADGFLLANEPIRSRLAPLAYNLGRTGSDRYAVSCSDPDDLANRLGGIFDVVVVDAPCSGQALLGQDKQSVSAFSAKQVEHSASRQNRILDSAKGLLREGGRIVYSTCTFAEAENEAQVERMINLGGAPVQLIDKTNLSDYESGSHAPGCYRLWPHRHQCAGSFASAVEFDEAGRAGTWRPRRRKAKSDKVRLPDETSAWFGLSKIETLAERGPVLLGWPSGVPEWAPEIAFAGPEIAYRTGKTWKPSHSVVFRSSVPCVGESIHVDASLASAYLEGQPVDLGSAGASKDRGWRVVESSAGPLGWAKSDGRIAKNHLPGAAKMTGVLN